MTHVGEFILTTIPLAIEAIKPNENSSIHIKLYYWQGIQKMIKSKSIYSALTCSPSVLYGSILLLQMVKTEVYFKHMIIIWLRGPLISKKRLLIIIQTHLDIT